MREKRAVNVPRTIAAGRRAVDAVKLHRGGGGDSHLVTLHRPARLHDAHLVSVGDRASGRTEQTTEKDFRSRTLATFLVLGIYMKE